MKIEIVTPEKIAYLEEADQVTLPTSEGEITILPSHTPLVTNLLPGELTVKKSDHYTILASGGGFAEVTDKKVSVVTDFAERPEEIDEREMELAVERAQQSLREREKLSKEEFATTTAALQRSLTNLHVKRKHTRFHRV